MRNANRGWILVLLAVLFPGSDLSAQIPDEFTNLQLLPKDIGKQDLVATMRGWASGLGVRCNYCHVGPDNLQGMDFATDEKPQKRTAREMVSMSRAINVELLAALPTVGEGSKHQAVSCFTCHRRQSKPPRDVVNLLSGIYRESGLDATLEEYRRLRREHFAAGQYDFRPRSLNGLAGGLLESGKPEEALKVLEANRVYFPESADVEAAFGFFYLQTGEAEKAEVSFKRALEIDPEHGNSRFGLSRIEAMRQPQEQ